MSLAIAAALSLGVSRSAVAQFDQVPESANFLPVPKTGYRRWQAPIVPKAWPQTKSRVPSAGAFRGAGVRDSQDQRTPAQPLRDLQDLDLAFTQVAPLRLLAGRTATARGTAC
jgi:hypothetical protein